MSEDLEQNLFEVIKMLEEYLPYIVLGGGWASLIYYHYLWGEKDKFPIQTYDFDFIVKNKIPESGQGKLINKLEQYGLKPNYTPITNTPIGQFEGEINGVLVSIEFLTYAGYKRSKDSIEVQTGIWAQTLEYLNINIENKIPIVLNIEGKELTIWVPKPAAFIFNKGLVFTRRMDDTKKAKDLYYIFDILSFRDSQKIKLIKEIKEVAAKYHNGWLNTFKNNLNKYFIEEPKNGINMVFAQKPAYSFTDFNDDQLKNHIEYIFKTFIKEIES
ncbi:MAG: GSU2403 family nucleotidyltransferase fold protein [Ignavibacteriaceae bacterium]|nr:GSU2403 family nucleotidyltransferase fold protein [Ignavibacteriaceae bacterium]